MKYKIIVHLDNGNILCGNSREYTDSEFENTWRLLRDLKSATWITLHIGNMFVAPNIDRILTVSMVPEEDGTDTSLRGAL